MEKRWLLFPLFFLLFGVRLIACDVCGANIQGNGVGMLTGFRNNFIGVAWQYRHFHLATEHGTTGQDYFHAGNLNIRYHLNDRFKLLLNQGFQYNLREIEQSELIAFSGWTDSRVVLSYTILNDKKLSPQTKLFFELGGGVHIPIGKYQANLYDLELPASFNPGNGSWGLLLQPTLVLSRKKSGMLFSGQYASLGASRSGYQFGNQLSLQASIYQQVQLSNSLTLIPHVGFQLEETGEEHFANGTRAVGTGGKGTFFQAGLNSKFSNWMLGLAYAHPLTQNYAAGEVRATDRFSVQIAYLF
ncbi:MAG: hypothetical protein R2792_10280 [Saprospiraceae bacterium]